MRPAPFRPATNTIGSLSHRIPANPPVQTSQGAYCSKFPPMVRRLAQLPQLHRQVRKRPPLPPLWPHQQMPSGQCGRPRRPSPQSPQANARTPEVALDGTPPRTAHPGPVGQFTSTKAPPPPPTAGPAVNTVGPVGPAINASCLTGSPAQPPRPRHQCRWPGRTSHQSSWHRFAQLQTPSVSLAHRIPATPPAPQASARTPEVAPDGTPLSTAPTAPSASFANAPPPLAPPTVGLAVSAVGPVGPAINVGCLAGPAINTVGIAGPAINAAGPAVLAINVAGFVRPAIDIVGPVWPNTFPQLRQLHKLMRGLLKLPPMVRRLTQLLQTSLASSQAPSLLWLHQLLAQLSMPLALLAIKPLHTYTNVV